MPTSTGNDVARSLPIGTVFLAGQVAVGATGDPTLTKARNGFTIARTAAGRYTVTFDHKHAEMLHWGVKLGSATPGTMEEYNVEEHTAYDSSTGDWVFSVGKGSGEAEVSDGATMSLFFFMKYNNVGG